MVDKDLASKLTKYRKIQKKQKARQKIVTMLIGIVVFCTTYALILPAITHETETTCGYIEHQHTEECYESPESELLICEMEEHTHDEILCYLEAEILMETEEEWEATLPEELGEDKLENLLLVAESQIGYEESTETVTVDDDGVIYGATRYGSWYGDPYGKWDAMFVSFCMHYAGIDSSEFPYESNSYRLNMEANEAGLYAPAEEYEPQAGDLVFFETTGDGNADRVGIVTEIVQENGNDAAKLITVEGDTANDCVEYCSYELTDIQISGYGKLSSLYREEETAEEMPEPENEIPVEEDEAQEPTEGEVQEPTEGEVQEPVEDEVQEPAEGEVQEPVEDEVQEPAEGEVQEPVEDEVQEPVEDEVQEPIEGEEAVCIESCVEDCTGENCECACHMTTVQTAPEGELSELAVMSLLLEEDSAVMAAAEPEIQAAASGTIIAAVTEYDQSLFTETNIFVIYTEADSKYYAFDGNGNAVEIAIDEDGNILTDAEDPDILFWSFAAASGTNSYLIQNVSSGRYMHAYPNNGSGVTTGGAYPSTLIFADGGVRIMSNSEFAQLDVSSGKFTMTQSESSAAIYNFGYTSRCTIWLDGTNGGLMSNSGSPNESYTVEGGETFTLPLTWDSPGKYNYRLRGWYDVKNNTYYAPGTEIEVTENLVFYADWEAATYDIGQFNADVANTVSTSEFVTTRVFDYSALFNVLSESASVTANSAGHTETWNLITGGTVPYNGNESLNFIFSDYDQYGVDITYPNGNNDRNKTGGVYSGLYTGALGEILFGTENSYNPSTGEGIIGKEYLGTADHLFQIMTDSSNEYYGYYYYDSSLNAASYNQSAGRFYVYDYLERTADSEKDGGAGEYSDFLPFNSPYANTNGKRVKTYDYNGRTNYMYDAKYNTNNNSTDNVGTNYWFGMSIDIDFYLPNAPGSTDSNGDYGNHDIYGNEMHFHFSGDDDVWVMLDGELVLDLGGVHGIESGDINFSTGAVTINGSQESILSGVDSGEHTLTVYYLERGSSQSNCAIYFNLAPRFGLSIQKEDVVSQEVLNGAEFTVYEDKECTIPVDNLWTSKEAYINDETPASTFKIENGVAYIWGLGAGNTYYIKETKPPDAEEYGIAHGIICLTLDKLGTASYSVEIISETDEDGNVIQPSNGFTVHGFKIDEETQQAYIVITNAQESVVETTTVQVLKRWNDEEDHTLDSVKVYLTVTDADGTVRRIREVTLNTANDWEYTWTSLPKYASDGVTEIQYGVEEAYKSGYQSTIEKLSQITIVNTVWAEALSFENGKTYLLKTANGCLAATSSSAETLRWMEEDTAKSSPLALWTATVSGDNVKFTNGAGQVLSFNHSWQNRYFYATTETSAYQNAGLTNSENGISLYFTRNSTKYYLGTTLSNGRLSAATSSGSALVFNPLTQITEETVQEIEDTAYLVTNTPLEKETSLKVIKNWDVGNADPDIYEQEQVTIRLYADGKDTGRTVTLSLKNNWTDTFQGLPYENDNGEVIDYTVLESWDTEDWVPEYGERIYIDGDPGTYEITVTNTYRWGYIYDLPSTGGIGDYMYTIEGFLIIVTAGSGLLYKFKKKKEGGLS